MNPNGQDTNRNEAITDAEKAFRMLVVAEAAITTRHIRRKAAPAGPVKDRWIRREDGARDMAGVAEIQLSWALARMSQLGLNARAVEMQRAVAPAMIRAKVRARFMATIGEAG